MAKNPQSDADSAHLQALSGVEQVEFALGLLNLRTRRDTLRAALKVLQQSPAAGARPALHTLFAHYGRANGAHDYGCYLRADLLRALRPIQQSADADLLDAALHTYEFPPPHFVEEASLLRSIALVSLADLDDGAARYAATRLLVDLHVDKMSGEPAVTAARVLAACGETLALYQYVVEPRPGRPPEIAAECLRALVTLHPAYVDDVLSEAWLTESGVCHAAAIDLLLRHESGPLRAEWLLDSLRRAPLEVYRYALFAIVAAGNDGLMAQTVAWLGSERDPHRIAAALDALDLARARADVAALLASPAFRPASRTRSRQGFAAHL